MEPMLRISKKIEYAFIAICHLSSGGGETYTSAREISEIYNLSLPLLANVMKTLNRKGILRSVRGSRGGYRLAAGAGNLTLGEVIEAMDGPFKLVACADNGAKVPCERKGICPARDKVIGLHEAIEKALAGISLSSIECRRSGNRRRVSSRK